MRAVAQRIYGKPNTTRRFWLPHHQAANRFRQPDKKGINHDNRDGRGGNCG
jgi:hypothetical protein